MNKTCIIIGREFSTRVRKKSFLVVTLVVPILMALFYAFLMWILLKDDTQERKIAVVNHSAIEAPFHQINNTTFETIDTEVTEASAPEFLAAHDYYAVIRLSANGSLYDSNSATDDAAARPTSIAFAQEGDALVLTDQPGDITVDIPATGDCTLIIDLSDNAHWTATVQAGSQEEEEAAPLIFLPGVDDLSSGGWNFDNYLRLYDNATQAYAGVANVNSEWGYQIAIERDNWNDFYALGEGDAYAGTLLFKSSSNLPAPTPGLYLMNVSLSALTYSLTPVQTVYYSGFNDNWDLHALAATDTPGVYTATVDITGETPWGFQIVLDEAWVHTLGGGDGILLYQGTDGVPNIPFSGEPGTYLLTVDLVQATYTLTLQ